MFQKKLLECSRRLLNLLLLLECSKRKYYKRKYYKIPENFRKSKTFNNSANLLELFVKIRKFFFPNSDLFYYFLQLFKQRFQVSTKTRLMSLSWYQLLIKSNLLFSILMAFLFPPLGCLAVFYSAKVIFLYLFKVSLNFLGNSGIIKKIDNLEKTLVNGGSCTRKKAGCKGFIWNGHRVIHGCFKDSVFRNSNLTQVVQLCYKLQPITYSLQLITPL